MSSSIYPSPLGHQGRLPDAVPVVRSTPSGVTRETESSWSDPATATAGIPGLQMASPKDSHDKLKQKPKAAVSLFL